jgi:hypothetical protein
VKLRLATLSVSLIAAIGGQAAQPPPLEIVVSTAVENFQPLWLPPPGQLQGWVIGIDPAESRGSDTGGRLCDDLSLLTAAHLYHLVLRAGGSPVLTRVDATPAADAGGTAWQRRVDIVRQAGCDLCVSIRFDGDDGKAAVRVGAVDATPSDAVLADALRAALGVEAAGPGGRRPADAGFIEALRQADGTAAIAVCEVHFGCPAASSKADAARQKACLERARQLYAGIRGFCENAKHPSTRAAPAPVPDLRRSRTAERLKQLGRSIWPQGSLPSDQVDWFCRRFAELSITNRSLVYFEVSGELERGVVALRGRTNAPQVVSGLEQALRVVGVEHVRNEVQRLPDRQRLGEQLFGVCRVPMALTYDQPGERGGRQTQLLFGEQLFLLDYADQCYLLHAGDGYWGWVRREAVQPMTAEQFDAYMRRPRGVALQDIDEGQLRIPRGSSVRVVRATEGERTILLPDGSTLAVPAAAVMIPDAEGSQAASRVRAALDLLYVPYLFGGCSPLGLDCSGLATNVQVRAGHRPSRDAWQQAFGGWLVAAGWHRAGIQSGDQLFFINGYGKIYHTGVALDTVHVLHAAPPCVQIGSLDPQDPLYDPELDRDFFMAKRP